MSVQTRVARVGNSIVVRLSKPILEEALLKEGEIVQLSVLPGRRIVVRPVRAGAKRKRFTLRELLREFKPEHRRPEVDWGAPVGKEIC